MCKVQVSFRQDYTARPIGHTRSVRMAVLGDQKGRVYPESFLSRFPFTTRYVRRLDKNGFLRYQDWKFYGEWGLAKAKVTVWI